MYTWRNSTSISPSFFADIPERDICVMVSVIEETWELLSNDDFKLTLSNSKEV